MGVTSLALDAPLQIPAVLGLSASQMVFGFQVGTGGATTIKYLKARGSKGYAFTAEDPNLQRAPSAIGRSPAENLEHIRAVLQPNVTDLARALGVSRQAIYDWQAGRPIAATNVQRIEDLARAADLFAREGLHGTAQVMRRPISGGKNLFEIVRIGGSAEDSARMLIEIVRRELKQRESLKARFRTRSRPTRDDFSDLGAPMLNEKS
jgi:hypothetical protein